MTQTTVEHTDTQTDQPARQVETKANSLRARISGWASRRLLHRTIEAEPLVVADTAEQPAVDPAQDVHASASNRSSSIADRYMRRVARQQRIDDTWAKQGGKPSAEVANPGESTDDTAVTEDAPKATGLARRVRGTSDMSSYKPLGDNGEYEPKHATEYAADEPQLAGKHRLATHLAKHALEGGFDGPSQNPVAAEQGDAYQGRYRAEP